MKNQYVVANVYLGKKLVRAFVGRNDDLEDLLVSYTEVLSALPDHPRLEVCILNVYERNETK